MPATVKVKVIAGRDLPVMDRASEMADPFVEIKFNQVVFKTEIYQKSLNPFWNSQWYTFEADDEELQEECLQFRVMDYDTYSANDAIGRVYLDLSPFLSKRGKSTPIGGWFPIYDTMHGIRGELNVCVNVNLFTDANKYNTISGGFEVFSTPSVPYGYNLIKVHGFVEQLTSKSDPEYQWIDKIRTPRASNEARQALFAKLAGYVIRLISRKTIDMGGNAVIGYSHHFDMESGSGIVVRGVGTAVTLEKKNSSLSRSSPIISAPNHRPSLYPLNARETEATLGGAIEEALNSSAPTRTGHYDENKAVAAMDRKIRAVNIQFSYATGGHLSLDQQNAYGRASPSTGLLFTEYPFLTTNIFPKGQITALGGVVCARSVKLLKNIDSPDENEAREQWWREVRMEVRSHMKTLNCNVVIGYEEQCSVFQDLCLLSVIGTAAILTFSSFSESPRNFNDVSPKESDPGNSLKIELPAARFSRSVSANSECTTTKSCTPCHFPFSDHNIPFTANLGLCRVCKNNVVPRFLLVTIDLLSEIDLGDSFHLVQARVVRAKQDLSSEALAKDVSNMLPFLEHELHSQLIGKAKLMGKNAIFGLKTQIVIGESHFIATATGTALYIKALADFSTDEHSNGHYKESGTDGLSGRTKFFNEENAAEKFPLAGRRCNISFERDAMLSELDTEDPMLRADPKFPSGFFCCNTLTVPSTDYENLNAIMQLQLVIRVAQLNPSDAASVNSQSLGNKMNWLLKSSFYKFRRLKPICLASVNFAIDISQNDLQVTMTGMVLTSNKESAHAAKISQAFQSAAGLGVAGIGPGPQGGRLRQISGGSLRSGETAEPSSLVERTPAAGGHHLSQYSRQRYFSLAEDTKATKSRQVFVTPLVHPPHSIITNYLGRYDFFFIRETTSLRESGGLDAFLHLALTEVLYVVQAHVAAFGGHGMTSFQCRKTEVVENLSRNQAQCLIAVAGDIVTTLC